MHLEKFAAAARIASACMSGCPEDPDAPLQSSLLAGPMGAGGAPPNSPKDPPGIRPGGRGVKKRSSWLCARASPMELASGPASTPKARPAAPNMLQKCLPAVMVRIRDPFGAPSDAALSGVRLGAP